MLNWPSVRHPDRNLPLQLFCRKEATEVDSTLSAGRRCPETAERSIHVVNGLDGRPLKTVTVKGDTAVNEILMHFHEEEGRGSKLVQGEKGLHRRMTVSAAGLADGEEVSLILLAYCQRAKLDGTAVQDESLDQYKDPNGRICVQIPSEVERITSFAFAHNPVLVKVLMHDRVSAIGHRAFLHCGLKQVNISNSVTSIGHFAFHECRSLERVVIPNSVTIMGNEVFSGCSGLEKVEIEGDSDIAILPFIGIGAFRNCSSLKQVDIPSSVTCIGAEAFHGCTSLVHVAMPASVTKIDSAAFCGCCSLKEVQIPNALATIEEHAFRECRSLRRVVIPKSVTSIGTGAFYGCSSLEEVEIPKSIKSIGSNAFAGCSLKQVPEWVTRLASDAFDSRSEASKASSPSQKRQRLQGCE